MFLPHAVAHARVKLAICARYGIEGLPPLNESVDITGMRPDAAWRTIFDKDLSMMEEADFVIANLTPFRGASADSGTLVELGWFLGRGKPVFAYSNSATPFAERSRALAALVPDPLPNLHVEGFGLPDNLMIPGAVLRGGGHPIVIPGDGQDLAFDALDMFEACVALASRSLRAGDVQRRCDSASTTTSSSPGPAS